MEQRYQAFVSSVPAEPALLRDAAGKTISEMNRGGRVYLLIWEHVGAFVIMAVVLLVRRAKASRAR